MGLSITHKSGSRLDKGSHWWHRLPACAGFSAQPGKAVPPFRKLVGNDELNGGGVIFLPVSLSLNFSISV
jgi:hypothetical protein